MKKLRMGIVAVSAVGALAVGPAAANAVSSTSVTSTVYASAATSASPASAAAVEPQVFRAAARAATNYGRAAYAGFKAGTSPREVGRVLGWGSFMSSAPVEDAKSFNQDQAFDR